MEIELKHQNRYFQNRSGTLKYLLKYKSQIQNYPKSLFLKIGLIIFCGC